MEQGRIDLRSLQKQDMQSSTNKGPGFLDQTTLNNYDLKFKFSLYSNIYSSISDPYSAKTLSHNSCPSHERSRAELILTHSQFTNNESTNEFTDSDALTYKIDDLMNHNESKSSEAMARAYD